MLITFEYSLDFLDYLEMLLNFNTNLATQYKSQSQAIQAMTEDAVLIISWKREIIGGVIFILAGILYIIFAFNGADSWLV